MALQETLQRSVIEDHMEEELIHLADELYGKKIEDCTAFEVYMCVQELTKELADQLGAAVRGA